MRVNTTTKDHQPNLREVFNLARKDIFDNDLVKASESLTTMDKMSRLTEITSKITGYFNDAGFANIDNAQPLARIIIREAEELHTAQGDKLKKCTIKKGYAAWADKLLPTLGE